MAKYVPNRLIISNEAEQFELTNKITERVKKLNPQVIIEKVNTNSPGLPSNLNVIERSRYLNETLLLCVRSKQAPFMEIFSSPGRVVENLGVNGKPLSRCPLACPFCYLQHTPRVIPWNRVYVNMDRFKDEWIKEEYVHKISLTLWTVLSKLKSRSFDKVPDGYHRICNDKIRKAVLSKRLPIDNHDKALDYILNNIEDILGKFDIAINVKTIAELKKDLPAYYKQNKKIPLSINVSEYSDLLGLDHITHYTDLFLGWIEENSSLRMKFRTKAPYIKNILKYNDLSRIKVTVDLNTEHHVSKYQPNTYSLKARIDAVNVLIKHGAEVCLSIEPIIKYNGFENEYKQLMGKINKEIDLKKIEDIKIGTSRYKTSLKNYINKVHPGNQMVDTFQDLQEPQKKDKRWRYSLQDRIDIYQIIIDSLPKQHRTLIKLGSENPEIWEELKLDKSEVHKDTVIQL